MIEEGHSQAGASELLHRAKRSSQDQSSEMAAFTKQQQSRGPLSRRSRLPLSDKSSSRRLAGDGPGGRVLCRLCDSGPRTARSVEAIAAVAPAARTRRGKSIAATDRLDTLQALAGVPRFAS